MHCSSGVQQFTTQNKCQNTRVWTVHELSETTKLYGKHLNVLAKIHFLWLASMQFDEGPIFQIYPVICCTQILFKKIQNPDLSSLLLYTKM